ncbi:MAG: serine hydroxymethyltransferase [Hyphomonadaceae bacterium]
MSTDDLGDVIFEITRIGDVQRVAAVHVESGVEVVVQAPAGAALADVRALALKKLERALASDDGGAPPERPGKLV